MRFALAACCSLFALSACGGDEIVSPGTSGDIIINNPGGGDDGGGDGGDGDGDVTPAAGCPTINATGGLTDGGTISGPTGEYRICSLPPVIDTDTTLPSIDGLLYALEGRVDIGTDQGPTSTGSSVELTIDPGVILYGATGRSFLVANRGNQLIASGTATQPIIFTSRDNVLGLSDDNSTGQWGGVVLLGRAPVSDCRTGVFNNNGQASDGSGAFDQASCEQELEGASVTTLFGGTDSSDSSGALEFVQIRFSGFSLAPGNELQSLTTGGIGSGTVLRNIMSFNSSDDGMEFFGGSVNMQNAVAVGADDDSFDVDTGAQVNMQYVVGIHRTGGGDNLIELDSPDSDFATQALPQTVMQVSNFTFIEQSSANSQAVRARGGAKLVLANGVIETATETCFRIDETVTLTADPDFESIAADCDPARPFRGESGVTDADVEAQFDAGMNNDELVAITLSGLFFSNSVPAFDPTTLSSFFETTDFIGAVASDSDTRFRDWTCNSSIFDFNSISGSCTSLPTP